MIAIQCSCGFRELADEEIIDHLERVFAPDDMVGKDGRVHEETGSLSCGCGFSAITPLELDAHFLQSFTPDGFIGRDGEKHEAFNAA